MLTRLAKSPLLFALSAAHPPAAQHYRTGAMAASSIKFGPYEVASQVFLTTALSFALVNLKPLVPGHVLVCPRQGHLRLATLTAAETADLFTAVQQTQRVLARAYGADVAFTVAVQDGQLAGQTVPHVHVHVIPRTEGDGGDRMYERMAGEEGNVGGALWDRSVAARPLSGGAMGRVDDGDRRARTDEDMEAEAARYRELLKQL